jgi:hypothetical protein
MLIGNGHDHFRLFTGYLMGAGVMIVGGVVEIAVGVPAEQRSLEDVASPLSSVKTFSSPQGPTTASSAPRPQVASL